MKFTKMQGCGNDYVYIDSLTQEVPEGDKGVLVRRLSDRHFGVGGDGVIFIHGSKEADFEMEMYNADGSRAEMCGNGIRCVGKYVYDKGFTGKKTLTVVSCGKVKTLELGVKGEKVETVRVDMGEPVLRAEEIPVISDHERVVDEDLEVEGKHYKMTCVSMGNPHAVIFVDDVTHMSIEEIGPSVERHPRFPNKVNTEFVQVVDREHLLMRVWERGTGETLACGTGACASAVACVLNGLTSEKVAVKLLGGEIQVEWDREKNLVYMTGPAVTVFEGSLDD